MDISAELDQLNEALAGQGLPGLTPPPDPTNTARAIEELENAVAPYRLPEDLKLLWRRVGWMELMPYPRLSSPESTLEGLQMYREDFPRTWPDCLAPAFYESHTHLLVELEGSAAPAGSLFITDVDGQFDRFLPGPADWVAFFRECVEGEALRRKGEYAWIDVQGSRPIALDRLEASTPHPIHGTTASYGADPADWPQHWAPVIE